MTTLPRALPRRFLERRFAALALTALVHALLIVGWQAASRLPRPSTEADGARIQWIDLWPRAPVPSSAHEVPLPVVQLAPPARVHVHEHEHEHEHERTGAHRPAPAPAASPSPSTPAPAPAQPTASGPFDLAPPAAPGPDGGGLVARAMHDAGAVDRALRKQNKDGKGATFAAPDSPALRMRQDMEAAHDMAPNKWYEAPKIDELNAGNDGTRRTRVRTAFGTYCVTSRPAQTRIDVMEMLGKIMVTTCPKYEPPRKPPQAHTGDD